VEFLFSKFVQLVMDNIKARLPASYQNAPIHVRAVFPSCTNYAYTMALSRAILRCGIPEERLGLLNEAQAVAIKYIYDAIHNHNDAPEIATPLDVGGVTTDVTILRMVARVNDIYTYDAVAAKSVALGGRDLDLAIFQALGPG
jgi:molecular chaperone DnaK (HSP70)